MKAAIIDVGSNSIPVSYTHLDVYKRQANIIVKNIMSLSLVFVAPQIVQNVMH